jgi:aldehyde:ferredoxin oxidoreductase
MADCSFEESFEIKRLEEQLGLNHWESQLGMDFWIRNEFRRGRLKKIMGEEIPANEEGDPALSPEFVYRWWKAVAHREGEGDVWAEGTPRAAEMLGLEDEVWKTHKHGYGPHWDGRYLQFVHFPVWVVAALGWAAKGRDPFNHQHGYLERYPPFVKEWNQDGESMWGTPTVLYEKICELGAEIYGAEHANSGWANPELGYTDKEYVGVWHEYRAIIKDSVPMCDRQFPLLYDTLSDPPKVGVIDAEVQAFNAVVGTDWTLDEMHKHCEKVRNVVRALHVRQGRTRDTDETVIPYFEKQPDAWEDEPPPSILEPEKFRALLDRYYELRGWDKATGWPTRAKLEEVGLKGVADELERLGKLS